MVDKNCKTPNRNHQKLHPETVMVAVIGGPELDVDQVDCGTCTSDVNHLVKQQIITQGEIGNCIKDGEPRADWRLAFMHVLYSEMKEDSRSK